MAAASRTLRVNQLDALRVDEELLLLVQQEVTAALQHSFPAAVAKYSRELLLLLQLLFFGAYTLRNRPTPGAVLQNIRYADSSGCSRRSESGCFSSKAVSSSSRSGRSSTGTLTSGRCCASSPESRSDSSAVKHSASTSNTAEQEAGGRQQQELLQQQQQHQWRQASAVDGVYLGQLLGQGAAAGGEQRRLQPVHGEVWGVDEKGSSSKRWRVVPSLQQNLLMRQRLLLLLVFTVLPYCFEYMQRHIHRRYIALLAVLQQRMLRTQAIRRMQQQLLRQPQQQQSSSFPQQQQQHHAHQPQHDWLLQQHLYCDREQQQHQYAQQGVSRSSSGSTEGRSSPQGDRRLNSSSSRSYAAHYSSRGNSREEISCVRREVDAAQESNSSRPVSRPSAATPLSGAAAASTRAASAFTAAALPSTNSTTSSSNDSSHSITANTSASGVPAFAAAARAPFLVAPSVTITGEEKRILLLYKASQVVELLLVVGQLVQTLCFLVQGKHRCLSDWLLLLRMQHINPSLQRSITLDLLQQQLAWQAVLQLLVMLLPQLPQQQFSLRALLVRARRIYRRLVKSAAQTRSQCVDFLQQQLQRQHSLLQQQREPHMLVQQEHQQQEQRHAQRQRRHKQQQQHPLHKAASKSHRGKQLNTANKQEQDEQQQEGKQLDFQQLLQQKAQHDTRQRRRRRRRENQLPSFQQQDGKSHRAAARRNAKAVHNGEGLALLPENERGGEELRSSLPGELLRPQLHAASVEGGNLCAASNMVRYATVRSTLISNSCTLLLRILQPSSTFVPNSAATPAPAAAVPPVTTADNNINAADTRISAPLSYVAAALPRPHYAAAAAPERALGPVAGAESKGSCICSIKRLHKSRKSTAGRRKGMQRNCKAENVENYKVVVTHHLQPDSSRHREACMHSVHRRRSRGGGGEQERRIEADESEGKDMIESEVQKTREAPAAADSVKRLIAGQSWSCGKEHTTELQQQKQQEKEEEANEQEEEQEKVQQEEQAEFNEKEQEQDEQQEEELACVFCGREVITLAFRSSNCSHRFCYYCVAAHPTYQQQLNRQRAAAATPGAFSSFPSSVSIGGRGTEKQAGFKSSAIGGTRGERIPKGIAGARTLGAAANGEESEAVAAAEQQRRRTAGAEKRGRESRGSSSCSSVPRHIKNKFFKTSTTGSSAISCGGALADSSDGRSSSSSGNARRRETSNGGWLAFFSLTLDDEEEEDTLTCPACGAPVEQIVWAS